MESARGRKVRETPSGVHTGWKGVVRHECVRGYEHGAARAAPILPETFRVIQAPDAAGRGEQCRREQRALPA